MRGCQERRAEMERNETSLEKRAANALEYVRELEIKDDLTLQTGNKVLVRIGEIRKEITDFFAEPIKKAHEAHKAILAKKKEAESPLIEAEGILKPKIRVYVIEQQRIKEEAERKAREEEERKKRETEEAMAKAVELENQGKVKEALDALDEAEKLEETKLAVDIPQGPTMTGVHTRTYWKWRIVDATKIPRMYLMLDQAAINEEVRRFKGDANIPGIEVYEETDIARTGLRGSR
jgi:dihydroxyacetone kinase-like predicted kinase